MGLSWGIRDHRLSSESGYEANIRAFISVRFCCLRASIRC
jgi:hypothetical protein